MKKSKFLITFLLIVTMILFYTTNSFAKIVDSDNGKMKFYNEWYTFDIQGYVNNNLESTTYSNNGYFSMLQVDDNEPELLKFTSYTDQIVDGVEWDINCSFVNNGGYVKITYTLTNTEETNKTISLGTYVDVQIANNDRATIERFENSNGLKLFNEEKNIQFSFYGKSVAGTTDIDNLWIGTYPEHQDEYFSNNEVNKIEEEDSAFTYSWVNRTLAAGSTNTYSVIIGIGEVSNSPKIELDQSQGKWFSQDSIILNGTVSDPDSGSKAIVYYTVDGGAEKNLEEKSLTNNTMDFSIDLTNENLSLGNHTIKIWTLDESGNPSEILEKEISITNLKTPTLEMSEEWSKDTVKFKITDTKNNSDDVVKYQYKIGDGEWTDVELDTETVALDKSGTVTVMARVAGKGNEEYSSVVSKTAKVDKDGPVISIVEESGKVTINTTDEQSGVDNTQYIFAEVAELDEQTVLLDYTQPVAYNEMTIHTNGTSSKSSVYLHVKSTDKLGNESTFVKEYKYPVPAQIESQEKFMGETPKYKLKDENNQTEMNYIFQVKINDGEWQNVNVDTEYTIDNPVEGTYTIKTRTLDTLGRISEESEKTVTYVKMPEKLPDAGEKVILAVILVAGILFIIGRFNKYNKLRDIK